jgi:hypothetical protein
MMLPYPETIYKDIVNVFSLFILNSFRDLSVKEVKEMLNFDLSSTRAGIELIGIGEKMGQKKWQKEAKKFSYCLKRSLWKIV